MELFKRVLNTVLRTLYTLPHNREIQDKIVFYLHRMIELLDANSINQIFPQIISQLFQSATEHQQIRNVLMLLNQLVARIKGNAINIVSEMFMPITSKVIQLLDNGNYDQNVSMSEESRLRVELHKHFFILLQTITTKDCISALTSPKNLPHLNAVLDVIIKSCSHQSVHLIKSCVVILQSLIQHWAGPNGLPNFNKYVYERIIPTCFSVPMLQQFDLEEATCNAVLVDIVLVLKTALIKCGAEFAAFMVTQFLPNYAKLAPEQAQAFMQQLQSANEREFKKVFKELIKARKPQ
jgi:exportin-T